MSEEPRKSKVSMSTIKVGKSSTGIIGKSSANLAARSMSRMKARRLSYGFGTVPGIRAEARTSQVAIEFKRPPLLFLNTYQLEPHTRFSVPQVTEVIQNVMDELFTNHKYNSQDSPSLTLKIAGEVMRSVKALSFNRYRVICVATIGQRRAQSYNNAVAFLWDHERDGIVDVQREVTTAFLQITVFGIYLD